MIPSPINPTDNDDDGEAFRFLLGDAKEEDGNENEEEL